MNVWIFESSLTTHHECLSRSLFGSSANWPSRVKAGDVCFLYNFTEKMIYGVWFSESDGAPNLEPDAWGGRYRFQVRVKRAGTTMQNFPKANVWRFICKPDSGYVLNRLQGERAHNLLQHFAHINHEAVVFEREFDAVEQDYRRRYPADYTTCDGHRVRSKSEMIIDDYLYADGEFAPRFEADTRVGGIVIAERAVHPSGAAQHGPRHRLADGVQYFQHGIDG